MSPHKALFHSILQRVSPGLRTPHSEHRGPCRRYAGRPARHRHDRARLVASDLAGRPCGPAGSGLCGPPRRPPDRQLDGGRPAMNATIQKFGHPATLIAEFDHWIVLLRPARPTLGALVLAAKSEATAFGDLRSEERRVGNAWVSKCRSRWLP